MKSKTDKSNSNALKTITVSLEYSGKSKVFSVPIYKTFKYIKELCKKNFNGLQGKNYRIYYMGKELTENDSTLITVLFKNKIKVFLKISKINDDTKKIGEKDEQLDELISLCSCDCHNDIYSNFCRTCRKFICDNCKLNPVHEYHKIMQVDLSNMEQTLKIYGLTLQGDIKRNSDSTKKIYDIMNNSNIDTPSVRKNEVGRKIEDVFDIYAEMNYKFRYLKRKYAEPEAVIKQYEEESQKINKEVEGELKAIHNNLTKTGDKMNLKEFREIFEFLSKKDIEFEKISETGMAYKVNFNLDQKMNEILGKIENILDEALNQKIPLGLDQKDYNNYMQMFDQEEDEKEDEKNKTQKDESKKKEGDSELNEEESEETPNSSEEGK
ncbi:MAG: B-box zinc finger protein [archaeon]|nr:B-box zinc finger protein [archaeon]